MNLSSLIGFYLPEHHVFEKKRVMFETLINLLSREDLEATLKVPIVDNLFGFISAKEHVELAIKWLEGGNITQIGDETK